MSNLYAVNSHAIGNFQIGSQEPADSTQQHQQGLIAVGVSEYWGYGEFVYAKAGGTIPQFGICSILPTLTSGQLLAVATAMANTANLGYPVFVAMVGMADGNWGWFMRRGVVPINSTASVAAGVAVGIAAAGQGGANTAGKQLLNAKVALAATTTVAKTGCVGVSGGFEIKVPNADGWFIGAYLSGTGVGAAAKITRIDPNGRKVTVDVANTAGINGTVTATYNNATIYYNVTQIDNPTTQGAIT